MAREPLAFAFAPTPAPDELLSSWLCRLAVGHGVSVATFLGGVGAPSAPTNDIDWACQPELLNWLARGSGRPRRELEAMTLAARCPGTPRRAFALAGHPGFPGGHAFCPACEPHDLKRWRHPVLRATDAGLVRLSCRTHGVFLDGADHPRELEPRRDLHGRWAAGLGGRPPRLAPKFALSLERALERASQGRDPGAAWWVREPRAFLAVVQQVAALAMLQRRAERGSNDTAAFVLLDDPELRRVEYGVTAYDPELLHQLTAWPRTRALAASALLLLRPPAARRLEVGAWARACVSYADRSLWIQAPWQVAGRAWSRGALDLALDLSASWPAPFRAAVRTQLAPFLALRI